MKEDGHKRFDGGERRMDFVRDGTHARLQRERRGDSGQNGRSCVPSKFDDWPKMAANLGMRFADKNVQ